MTIEVGRSGESELGPTEETGVAPGASIAVELSPVCSISHANTVYSLRTKHGLSMRGSQVKRMRRSSSRTLDRPLQADPSSRKTRFEIRLGIPATQRSVERNTFAGRRRRGHRRIQGGGKP